MATVKANSTCAVTLPGRMPQGIAEGDEFDSDDPLVRECPWLFESSTVEQATAVPGEKRSVSRKASAKKPAKKPAKK